MIRRKTVENERRKRAARRRPKRKSRSARTAVVLGLLVQVATLAGAVFDLVTR
ncbi:hypothetical protein ACFYOT_21935 [Saccharothrix saharensis]|uniref:hypothetical protein n=1 Tax=Saccharothrix saharensis TaxID=571190 RepID=UPI0036B0391E